jgi:hypothetical protein
MFIFVLTVCVFGQTKLDARAQATSFPIAEQPPYSWMDTVNLSSSDYTVNSNVRVCEIRCDDTGSIAISLPDATSIIHTSTIDNIWRLHITKVSKTGTSTNLKSGCKIRLFGFIVK